MQHRRHKRRNAALLQHPDLWLGYTGADQFCSHKYACAGHGNFGGRPLEVFGIPGHHAASIAVLDPTTGLLHTGDTVYPGRIYVQDSDALLDSLDRLVTFAAERTVTHVLGCHVEMTRRPGRDYPLGSRYQPDEPSPFMTAAQLRSARDAFRTVAHRPGIHRFDDVVFCVGEGPRVLVPLQLRALVEQVRWRLGLLRRRPAP